MDRWHPASSEGEKDRGGGKACCLRIIATRISTVPNLFLTLSTKDLIAETYRNIFAVHGVVALAQQLSPHIVLVPLPDCKQNKEKGKGRGAGRGGEVDYVPAILRAIAPHDKMPRQQGMPGNTHQLRQA